MLDKFRHYYPTGSLISDLIEIDRGLYLVKVTIKIEDNILSTGLAAEVTLEEAEDRARNRAISALMLDDASLAQTKKTEFKLVSATAPATVISNQSSDSPNSSNLNSASTPQQETVIKASKNPPTVSANEPPNESSTSESLTFDYPEEFSQESPVNIQASVNSTPVPNEINHPDFDRDEPNLVAEKITPEIIETIDIDFNETIHKTDIQLKRLGWTKQEGRKFLETHYGKKTRLHLTDRELVEFLHHLENLPDPS